jgi:hypothetical protein
MPAIIKNGIGEILHPVAQVNVPAFSRKTIINGQVSMAEHKIIYFFLLQNRLAIRDQPFPVFAQKVLFAGAGGRAAFAAEVIGQANADARRHQPEQALAYGVSKKFLQRFIAAVAGPKSIAMANIKCFIR